MITSSDQRSAEQARALGITEGRRQANTQLDDQVSCFLPDRSMPTKHLGESDSSFAYRGGIVEGWNLIAALQLDASRH